MNARNDRDAIARRAYQEENELLRAIAGYATNHVDLESWYTKRKTLDVWRDGNGNITHTHESYVIEENGRAAGSFEG